jgi:hypothetical protein
MQQRASQSLSFHQKLPPSDMYYWPSSKTGRPQNFAFLNQMDLLGAFDPYNTNGIFDSCLVYNNFWFIACLRCQLTYC